MFKTVDVETTEQLNHLYEGSALTFEGFDIDPKNLEALVEWLEEKDAKPKRNLTIYIIRGSYMNREYGLTGNNAYPDDLHIVCIDLDDMENWEVMILARMEVRGRWFDDVVAGNLYHEEEQGEEQ